MAGEVVSSLQLRTNDFLIEVSLPDGKTKMIHGWVGLFLDGYRVSWYETTGYQYGTERIDGACAKRHKRARS